MRDLVTAYLDGVGELTPDERKQVEAYLRDHPDEASATREMLAQLRALPHEGVEPDWNQLERAIRDAVGPTVPVPWWRRWRWLAPIGALAATATAALLWLHHPEARQVTPDAAIARHAEPPAPTTTRRSGGQIIDVGELDDTPVLDDPGSIATGDDAPVGILPADDLGWVDDLDDGAAERAEHWLERKKT